MLMQYIGELFTLHTVRAWSFLRSDSIQEMEAVDRITALYDFACCDRGVIS